MVCLHVSCSPPDCWAMPLPLRNEFVSVLTSLGLLLDGIDTCKADVMAIAFESDEADGHICGWLLLNVPSVCIASFFRFAVCIW